MSLFSPIHLDPKKIEREAPSGKNHKPAPFSRKPSHSSLSKNVEEKSLAALKEMLARQKRSADEEKTSSAVGPFSPQMLAAQDLSSTASLRIDSLEPSAEVARLYDKMVETLFFIHKEGIQETTLFLDNEFFRSSPFYGAKITITEYSTAPKIFNIQLSANPEGVSLFQAYAASLLQNLQKHHLSFEVNRLDAELLREEKKNSRSKIAGALEKEDKKQ